MSRTSLGYFEAPLTQEERDMIAVPFLGYKNKIEQCVIHSEIMARVNRAANVYAGCAIDAELGCIIDDQFADIIARYGNELKNKYSVKVIDKLFDPVSLWVKLLGGDFIVSNNLNLLKSGLYPEALCTITIADMGQDFVDFANNNIDLFYQPNKGPYGAANALLNKYINDQIESSNIGNRPILDHSKFISELIKLSRAQTPMLPSKMKELLSRFNLMYRKPKMSDKERVIKTILNAMDCDFGFVCAVPGNWLIPDSIVLKKSPGYFVLLITWVLPKSMWLSRVTCFMTSQYSQNYFSILTMLTYG